MDYIYQTRKGKITWDRNNLRSEESLTRSQEEWLLRNAELIADALHSEINLDGQMENDM